LVSAAVLGRLTGLSFGVDILITRDIRLAPARCSGELTNLWIGCRVNRILGSVLIWTLPSPVVHAAVRRSGDFEWPATRSNPAR
jgi:hypothetical protein